MSLQGGGREGVLGGRKQGGVGLALGLVGRGGSRDGRVSGPGPSLSQGPVSWDGGGGGLNRQVCGMEEAGPGCLCRVHPL